MRDRNGEKEKKKDGRYKWWRGRKVMGKRGKKKEGKGGEVKGGKLRRMEEGGGKRRVVKKDTEKRIEVECNDTGI